ncbi:MULTISPECIES: IclR family transcriptional regulator [Acinetobacter]|jgi:DNA-binding IclR family transcriptional regulator|uniref:HTH-type transcriptional regulator SrpS n=1 Tax=Acinetobacter pittii TaxID=48296 RepID=A0AB33BPZ2_ACIPI|nr:MULTISPECIES: IclR family transcriptional regulator [Acinetobacter]AMX19469.1 HTH-type transcriptional regulator SrpS [Acinetobacter pittii]KQC98352.1 hypothetical protein APD01_09975 [Acinetobacter soli]
MNDVVNPKDEEKNGNVQALIKAVNILNLLGKNSEGMSLGEIAQQIDLPRSTVQRLVNTLESVQYIRVEGERGISLGSALLRLISSSHSELISITRTWLRHIKDDTNETVVLSINSRSQLLIINRLISDRELQVTPRLGANIPLYGSAAGLALLSLESDEQIIEILKSETVQDYSSEYPKPNILALLEKIHLIQDKGFAISDDISLEGIMTIAIAIKSIVGNFAISLPVPTVRFQKNCDQYSEQLLQYKQRIEMELGLDKKTTY